MRRLIYFRLMNKISLNICSWHSSTKFILTLPNYHVLLVCYLCFAVDVKNVRTNYRHSPTNFVPSLPPTSRPCSPAPCLNNLLLSHTTNTFIIIRQQTKTCTIITNVLAFRYQTCIESHIKFEQSWILYLCYIKQSTFGI